MMGMDLKLLSAMNFTQYIQKKTSENFDEVFEYYKQYSKKALEGVHQKTAQFWFEYIEILHLYHEFIRSSRLGDLEL